MTSKNAFSNSGINRFFRSDEKLRVNLLSRWTCEEWSHIVTILRSYFLRISSSNSPSKNDIIREMWRGWQVVVTPASHFRIVVQLIFRNSPSCSNETPTKRRFSRSSWRMDESKVPLNDLWDFGSIIVIQTLVGCERWKPGVPTTCRCKQAWLWWLDGRNERFNLSVGNFK